MREVGGAVNVTQGKQPQSLACCPHLPGRSEIATLWFPDVETLEVPCLEP